MSHRRKRQRRRYDGGFLEGGSALVAIILFFLSLWASTAWFIGADDVKKDVQFALIFALLSHMVGVQFVRLWRFKAIDRDLDELHRSLDEVTEYDRSNHELIDRLLSLLKTSRVLRLTGFHALQEALGGFLIESDAGFIKISGKELTFGSYEFFWRQILELQLQPGGGKLRRGQMTARLTHSSEIGPWSGQQSTALRRVTHLHGEFWKNGGTVYRIFLDNGRTGALSDYEHAITEMRNANIKCAYMHSDVATNILDEDFLSDFCIIEPGNYSSDWYFDEKKVSNCEIGVRVQRYYSNLNDWDRLVKCLKRYEYDRAQGLTDQQVQLFTEAKEDFFDKRRRSSRRATAPGQAGGAGAN